MLDVTRRLLRYRGLLWTLVVRELKGRYRGSFLGFFWSLVNPLLLLAVYSFVFTYIFSPRFAEGAAKPYPLFLMCGLFPWVWVSTSLLEGTDSLLAGAGLIRKAVFPAEILPMVFVLSNLVHFLLALPVLSGGLLIGRFLGYPVSGWGAAWLPLIVGLEFLVVGGLTLGLAALNVHFKDVKDILTNVLAVLLYLTPILFPLSFIPWKPGQWAIGWLNPLAPFSTAFQETLFKGDALQPLLLLQMIGWAVIAWVLGTWLFSRLSDSLAEAV
ncbi:MAG: ABC transporter permease [bacterium]|nr:ABC transporter permease [bacterium]